MIIIAMRDHTGMTDNVVLQIDSLVKLITH